MMENSQRTSSVIGKLMGLDQTPPQKQSVSRPQRALSDNYLQKSGSIGKRSRTYSQNNLLGSKKRVNRRTHDSNKDSFLRNIGHKSFSFDGMQGMKSENGKSNTGLKNLLDSQTISSWEAKKQLLERLKITKLSKKHRSGSQSCILRDIFSLHNTQSMSRSDFSSSVGISSDEIKLSIFKRLNFSSSSTKKYVKTKIQSHEDVLRSSNCVQINEEHQDSKIEAYHHSPNSVLEPPFREDSSSSSEYCESATTDLHDLWMEDDFAPEMVTSSDDETSSCTGRYVKSILPFGAKESRDFSYLVDVLDESGFQGGNVEIQFEKWHSLESMAGPSVFETLEKKYGKQELWHKAERQLLFDSINTTMLKILKPRVDICVCSNSLQRKMRNMSRRYVIEEELLTFLLGQETEVNNGVSEKAVGRGPWFDPVDEIDLIVKEIEIFLFDELTTELVCIC